MLAWLSTYSIIHLFQPSILDPLQFVFSLYSGVFKDLKI